MTRALLAGFVVGVLGASACGPVKLVGPTALVLEVYFSEQRGTRSLLVSGTAEVDGVPINVFPTSQRPEQASAAGFPVPQTVRVLLNDSRAGLPFTLTVIGLDVDGDPVEAAQQTVTPVAQTETAVTVTLKPFTDTEDAGAGRSDAGFSFDAGPQDGGRTCTCPGGCCDSTGRCASPAPIPLASQQVLTLVLAGPLGQFCTTACGLGKANQFINGQCQCGNAPACGDGLRCQGTGASSRCVCDKHSGCRGCCSANVCLIGDRLGCGTAGNACGRCEGVANVCNAPGRCSVNTCTPPSPATQNQCCSGVGMVSSAWPTCPTTTGDCRACDVLRSNTCRPVAVNGASEPCGCGATPQCPADALCLLVNGAATCVRP